jgi:hypothetical protein
MKHNNFEVGKRYARRDGQIVEIIKRREYAYGNMTGRANTAYSGGALVIGDDGFERWDDDRPGFGICTGALNALTFVMSTSDHDLLLGVIPSGHTTSGPLKIK